MKTWLVTHREQRSAYTVNEEESWQVMKLNVKIKRGWINMHASFSNDVRE